MKKSTDKPIYVIVGPTASGKTELGVELALAVGGEVINCDSVQIYQQIQIATAKPSEAEKKGVPHHLIDYVSPHINYTAADWARDAAEKIIEIEARGNTAILVGGTGFYLRTLRNPLFDSPKTSQQLRDRLQRIREKKGAPFLHRWLLRVDKAVAEKIPERDYVRVIRALEVFYQTGELLSAKQMDRQPPAEFVERLKIFVISPPRDELYAKINVRTVQHYANGLVEEVKRLRASGVSDTSKALGSHGYRRVCEFLRGEQSLEYAMEKTAQDVRNYAKRQLTWFRKEADVVWLDGFGGDGTMLEKIVNTQ